MRSDLEQVFYRRAADTVDIHFGASVSGIEAAGAETAAVLTGGDRQISLYPISDRPVATFLLHRRDRPFEPRDPAVRAELHRVFAGFGWLVPDALAAGGPDCRPYYDAVEQVVLPNWSVGRTVLLGDAAWCVSLLAGQGVSLAMAGAYVLADELAATTDVPRALSRYERRMRPLAEAKQEEGRRTTKWFIPEGKIRHLIRDWALRISLWSGSSNIARRRFLGAAHLPPPAGDSPA
jgi:2-polyprenyl-6-methoxyphenol hydroxylase-like FAD-dependent oxidoreductase